jgi:hypothetical protein
MISAVEVFLKDNVWQLIDPPIDRSSKIDYIEPEEYAIQKNQSIEIDGHLLKKSVYLIEEGRGFIEWKL